MRAYIHRAGAPLDVGPMVAVKDRLNALKNPYAHLRLADITVESVKASPMMWDPVHYLESCPSSDGACAVVFTDRAGGEAAAAAGRPPAWILGSAMRSEPFGFPGRDPVGQIVTIDGQRFTVVGHYLPQGGGFGGDLDNSVYMPITTAQKLIGVSDVSYLIAKVADPADIPAVERRIAQLLAPRYGQNVSVFTQEQTLGVFSSVFGLLTWLLAAIAAISLLVGGIGIMNIMLVSVTERTREIGIRMAIGAKGRDILTQFLIEALALSIAGGAIGIALGIATSRFLAWQQQWPIVLSPEAILLAFGFSAAIGVFFGFYPARKASRLDPIEALRYE
jgi:putative ABC transport system permease protein